MQFDDNAIPSAETFGVMRQAYAKAQNKNDKVLTLSQKTTIKPQLFDLFLEEIELLNNLASRCQNKGVGDFLKALGQKSDAELKKLLQDFPDIDQSLAKNPIFYNNKNTNEDFKTFLQTDLDLIDQLAESLVDLSSENEKKLLFDMQNRHIQALKELFKIMHLITFY